jgi:hypothetical protein
MSSKDSFILYQDYQEIFEKLTDEQAGRLIKTIFEYEKTGVMPEVDNITEIIIIPIRQMLDKNRNKYKKTCERNKENIGKRWNKKDTKDDKGNSNIPNDTKNTSGISGIKKDTKNTDNDNDYEYDNEDKDKEKEIKNINIFNKEKKADNSEKEAKPPDIEADIQKSEDIQDMPQEVGLVVKSDQHKSIAGYSHDLKKTSEYAKYYKDFERKKQYAEFVFMKEQEYEALLVKYGDYVVLEAIEKLNIWKLEKLAKRCLKDIRGDDYRKMLSWTVNAVIETMKKIDYKKYQEYMENFEKQNNPELQLKILELIQAKELKMTDARELPEESINNIYNRWLKKNPKKGIN